MSAKDKLARVALNIATDRAIRYIKKDPDKNLPKLAGKALSLFSRIFPKKSLDAIKNGANNPDNTYVRLAKNIITDTKSSKK